MNDLGDEYHDQTPEEYGGAEETDTYPEPPGSPAGRRRSGLSRLLETFAIVFGAIFIALAMQAYVIKPFQIPSESMEPTIMPGDRILVNRLAYRYGDIERGDVIVFRSPENPDIDFVKRVIAIEGDTIEISNHMVIVNGEALSESYIGPWLKPNEEIFTERDVPEGKVFVMGDNRDNSEDSRLWETGPWLDEEAIIGEAMLTYWPLTRIQRI
ncbi:MAG: signal peptidase I [Thermoleophilia bacterium]